MPLRTRIFIIASVLILIILAVSVVLILYSKNKKEIDTETTTSTTSNNVIITQPSSNIPADLLNSNGTVDTTKVAVSQPTSVDIDKNAAKQTAKIFIERLGSYSTDSNYQNVKDVESLSSSKLWSSLSSTIKQNQTSQTYSGVTTKVISAINQAWSDTQSTYLLSTTRATTKNNKTDNENQDVEVVLVKSGSNWVVDSYQWE